jgi:hypothetical protein
MLVVVRAAAVGGGRNCCSIVPSRLNGVVVLVLVLFLFVFVEAPSSNDSSRVAASLPAVFLLVFTVLVCLQSAPVGLVLLVNLGSSFKCW